MGGGGGGGGGRRKKRETHRESHSLHKKHQSPPPPPQPAKSNFWPTMLSREQRGYKKSDPGGDHYYVGCLGHTRVSLPE